MKQFLKMTLAAIVGVLIAGVIMLFFTFSLIGSLATVGQSQPVMPREAVLDVNLSQLEIVEQASEDPFSSFSLASLNGTEMRTPVGLFKAVRAINEAAADPAIKFMYLRPDGVSGGLASIEELRTAIVNFRKQGKAVIALCENPGNASYYLATAADKIYLYGYAGGSNMLCGMGSQITYMKDILDRLGVNMQLIRHGKYKSAGEMYIKNDISPENRQQQEEMLSAIWKTFGGDMAQARGKSVEEIDALINGLKLNNPQDMLDNGLVDVIVDKNSFSEELCKFYGCENYSDIRSISLADYATIKVIPNYKAKDKIAVIYADGEIVDGDALEQVAGDRFAQIIADVRNDESVKAVVFRVNSPGGSVYASDKIKEEINALVEAKPVIASYGNYAASGGYWISNSCNHIFSDATTLTGSIGVFSLIPDLSKTIKDIAHVNMVTVKTHKHADMYGGMRPLDTQEVAYMQKSVDEIYDRFTSIVASGRGLEVKFVDSIAQGRVWAGSEAIGLGLVDEIGTLEDAVIYAAAVAGNANLADWNIAEYPKPLTFTETLLEQFNGSDRLILSGTPFEGVEKAFKNIGTDTGKVYVRMPYEITIY
ncbi:MAG: signal peptide peptidase SppA [Candidatus Cryptobacteroides sp.]